MKRYLILTLITVSLFAQDYSFSIPTAEKKSLEWSGNLDGKYSISQMRTESPFYQLQFPDNLSDYLSQYKMELYLNADYRTRDMGFHLKTHSSYYNDSNADFDLFEAYGNYNLSFNTNIHFGKQMFNWGKGYAFNPVGFVNPFKDPENPELAQAGLLSMSFETIKSFQNEWLKTVAFTGIIIPPNETINERYSEVDNTAFALKGYGLICDTDVDIMALINKNGLSKYGADFSLNLKENIEIHGETAFFIDDSVSHFTNGQLTKSMKDGNSWLFGMRYLNRWNTTIIAEYYHNDFGWSDSDWDSYLNVVDMAVSNGMQPSSMPSMGMTAMQDYIYLKFTQPEPFDWVYFSPSIYAIYNLEDKSAIIGAPMSYSPVNNFSVTLWPTIMIGEDDSEFGSKQIQSKFDLWMRFYF